MMSKCLAVSYLAIRMTLMMMGVGQIQRQRLPIELLIDNLSIILLNR